MDKEELQKKIIQMRENEFTYRQIKEHLNLSSTSVVYNYIKRANYQYKSRAMIRDENYKLKRENRELKNKLNKILDIIGEKNSFVKFIK